VVEDNADSRALLCELTEMAGFECFTADNGETGLAMLDQVSPDVVVADIGLPVIDGLEFARRVRQSERHAHVVLIALTGYGQARDRGEAQSAGFDHHLVKPVDSAALLRMISENTPTG
jgi:two-component system CheB/CheR fusion protein